MTLNNESETIGTQWQIGEHPLFVDLYERNTHVIVGSLPFCWGSRDFINCKH